MTAQNNDTSGLIDFLKDMDDFTMRMESKALRSALSSCIKEESDGTLTYVAPNYLADLKPDECDHLFDAVPIDGISANAPCEARCRKCGFLPSAIRHVESTSTPDYYTGGLPPCKIIAHMAHCSYSDCELCARNGS